MPRANKTIKHKPYTLLFSCKNKRPYKNEKDAQNIAEIQMLENINLELAVYKCSECNFWHLTRQGK